MLWCWESGISNVMFWYENEWCDWCDTVLLGEWCDAVVLGKWCGWYDIVVLGEWHDGVVLDKEFPILQRKMVPSSQGVQQSKKNDMDYLILENESDTIFQSRTTHSTIQCHIWEEWNLPHLNYFFKKTRLFIIMERINRVTTAEWYSLSRNFSVSWQLICSNTTAINTVHHTHSLHECCSVWHWLISWQHKHSLGKIYGKTYIIYIS